MKTKIYPRYVMIKDKGMTYWYRISNKKGKKKMYTTQGNFFVNPKPEHIEPMKDIKQKQQFYKTWLKESIKSSSVSQ